MLKDQILKIVSSFVKPVYADALGNRISGELTNVANSQDLPSLVNSIVNLAVPAGVLAAIILISYAGYTMIMSQGNPDKLNEAKEVVTNAVLGFALIALSVAILLLIRNTLNIPGINA